jgi:hypothetical protein
MKTNVAEAYTFLMQHWQPGEGFANSRTHPVVSGTGIKRGKKLCERAIPAGFRVIGRRRDRLPRLLVLTANQRHGRMRASIGEDLVGPVLLRPDVPLRSLASPTPRLAPLNIENRPRKPTAQDSETRIIPAVKSPASSTRESVTFSVPSALPRTKATRAPPLRTFLRNSPRSDATMCSAPQ